ncbi:MULTISPECIES: hypothetical protein [unclassified Oceanispirochaeta]|uniref:hypothetical protein n=1 Tax=unclassified Oceanispirochaeta TaxID=2635722 RepID=UPI000E08F315|nr:MULTISPECIES: hypothetical protein [unclassified Oceanispirochaeta]MBF9015845.1 hypothetical protein [Oceanispirochaeta sp. M2]NPD72308.1 hypothetical protein [Oceanispirochaeta sp. M1]RDG32080.1 hypothetical protein DV872_09365 [Oceanispirochaeta sp. M1]
MSDVLQIAGMILLLRIGQDTLFLAKIDAFSRGNRFYSLGINFFEAMYGITVIKIILSLMQQNPYYVIIYGLGSMLGGQLSGFIKKKLDKQLIGQRQYYVRISLESDKDRTELIQILSDREFEFTMSTRTYLNGNSKLIIEGSIANRQRMIELKEILRGRPGKHVTFLRADEIYLLE